jgi:superfamily II DNA or RNA helicase
MVYGGTEVEQRELIRGLLENQTDAILIASVACFATGTNIKNLHNAIMASPTKSPIRLLQSIGRILRLSEGKDIARWFDIADDLKSDKTPNYTLRHFFERIKIYKEEQFQYKIRSYQLTKNSIK